VGYVSKKWFSHSTQITRKYLYIYIYIYIFSFLIQLHRIDKDHTGQATRELYGQLAGLKESSFTAVCMIVKAPHNKCLVRCFQSKNVCNGWKHTAYFQSKKSPPSTKQT